jgi:signal transduction histidine kinase
VPAHNVEVKRIVWFIALSAACALVGAFALGFSTFGGLQALSVASVQYLFIIPVPFLTAGIWLLVRFPNHRAGWLLTCGTALTISYSALIEQLIRSRPDGTASWMNLILGLESIAAMFGLACISLLIGLFPSGKPRVRRERVFARLVWFLPVPMLISLLANENVPVDPFAYGDWEPFANPMHLEWLAALGPATAQVRSAAGLALLVAAAILLLRYREVSPVDRRQIRWVLFGSAAALAVGVFPFLVGPILGLSSPAHGGLMFLASAAIVLMPASVVIAVEQPRWIDTDAVIRKSLTYGLLTIGIFVAYAAVAAGLGLAAGARFPIEVAIVLTAALAFLAQPTRTRLQLVADRLVFGERPTAIAAVTEFEQAMRTTDEPTAIGEHLAELIRAAARLHWATVTIPPDPTHIAGKPIGDPALVVAIRRNDETFGEIRCGPRIAGPLTDKDGELVRALAGQAGLMIANLRLAGRIVQAQEAERRRIERNIHDGAQQELVALAAKLGLARTRAGSGQLDESILVELQADIRAILTDLRELAQGIHPSVLTDGGLVEAIEDRVGRLPIPVTVEASPALRRTRFDDNIEGAAYFLVTEGLTNTLKHAGATSARVQVDHRNGHLDIRVSDDGSGFETSTTHQNGLAGLSDRFEALGGTVNVESQPGAGTTLTARLPVAGA